MKNSSAKHTAMAPFVSTAVIKSGISIRVSFLTSLAMIIALVLCVPCVAGEITVDPSSQPNAMTNNVPEWSWDWVDDLKRTGEAIIPVPVTVNPQSSFQSSSGMNSVYRISQEGVETNDHRSLFSVLDDGEALLDLLDRSGRENNPGFEGMLSDTLNTSFLSLGSRLEFHVSKRFLPYLGGGIIYGGRDFSDSISANLPRATGYEMGVGFTFSDAPVRFGVDLLYRGMDLNEEDPAISLRQDETCPNSFEKNGYSMSMGFTFHF